MIKKNTILSTFNKKFTLMEWLKRVEKALTDSVLVDVTIITLNATQIQFSFNFTDGSHIITPIVTLPKGDKGDKGNTGAQGEQGEQGVSVVNVTINSSNHLIVTLSDGAEIDAGIIQGGSTITVDDAISSTSENPVQNKVIYTALQSKQNTLTASSISDGTIDKEIGFSTLGEIVKQTPDKEIFFATYGVTPFSEMSNAYNNGKLVLCFSNEQFIPDNLYILTRRTNLYLYFTELRNNNQIKSFSVSWQGLWQGDSTVTLQPQLVSSQNIKTINSQSLLGSGNINISGGTQLYLHMITITNPVNYKSYPSVTIKVLTDENLPIDNLIDLESVVILAFSVIEGVGELYPVQYDFSTRGYIWLYDDNTTSIVKYNIDGDTPYADVITEL